MSDKAKIGMSEEERKVMCEAYEQAKEHPQNRATLPAENSAPTWSRAVRVFRQKGYASSGDLSFDQNGGIFWFTHKGMKAAEIVCEEQEDYRRQFFSVKNDVEGYRETFLTVKMISEKRLEERISEDTKHLKDYELFNSEEGHIIYEDIVEERYSSEGWIEESQQYPEQGSVRSRLLLMRDVRLSDSEVPKEVVDHFEGFL